MTLWFARRLNRPDRGRTNRRVRGLLVLVLLVAIAMAVGVGLHGLARSTDDGWIVETVALILLLAEGPALQRTLGVGQALHRKGLLAGCEALAPLVPFDTDSLDEHGVARGAIEYGATSVCDAMVGPALFYIVLGLPGTTVYVFVTAAARAVATPAPHDRAFGASIRACDTLLNIVPAPIAGLLIALGALFGPGANPASALSEMVRRPAARLRPSQAWTISAVAGALGLALAGPRRYQGASVTAPWIGDGRARVVRSDVIRGAYLVAASGLVAIALAAFLFFLRSR